MSYARFAAMIATSTIVMFGLMYLNTYLLSHIFWSETRFYMALLMGATMAIVMLAFMQAMYSSRLINFAIFAGASLLFAVSLWLVRSQITVGDTSYMRAMIPHHSIAIMTSSRADISDPRVRSLADEIIYAQDKEIAEMRYLIADIEASGDQPDPGQTSTGSIVDLETALGTAHIQAVDPEFMSDAEIQRMFSEGARCVFTYTTDSPPVLAVGPAANEAVGLFKISGDLVQINAEDRASLTSGVALAADGVAITVTAPGGGTLSADAAGEPQEADMVLDLDAGLTVGYRGFYECQP